MANTRVFFVRHGETDNNNRHRFMGRTDMELNERGLMQAQYVSNAMKDTIIDCMYTSPYQRATRTGLEIKRDRSIELISDIRLCEIDCGLWEGLNREEIEQKWPGEIMLWQYHPHQLRMAEGETFEQVQRRGYEAYQEIIHREKGKQIVITSHMLTIQLILTKIINREIADVWNLPRLENTSITELEINDIGEVEVIRWGDASHLPQEFQNPYVKVAGFTEDDEV